MLFNFFVDTGNKKKVKTKKKKLTGNNSKNAGEHFAHVGPGEKRVLGPRHPLALLQIRVQAHAREPVQVGVGVGGNAKDDDSDKSKESGEAAQRGRYGETLDRRSKVGRRRDDQKNDHQCVAYEREACHGLNGLKPS